MDKFGAYKLFIKLFAGATKMPDAMEIIFQKAITLGKRGAVSNLHSHCYYFILLSNLGCIVLK